MAHGRTRLAWLHSQDRVHSDSRISVPVLAPIVNVNVNVNSLLAISI